MCGLLGVVRTTQAGLATDMEKFVRMLFIVDQVRGEHSTGLFAVPEKFNSKTETPVMYKKAMNAMDFLSLPYVKSVTNSLKDYTFFAGHNRYATRGNVTNANAHPFGFRTITLMHNGTINTFGKFHKDAEGVNVDSQVLTYLLSKHPVEEVLKEITGSYALIYHDITDNSLNLIRNDERPLLMGETNFGYVCASEEWMLEAAAAYSSINVSKIKAISPYHHYKFVTNIKGKGTTPDVSLEVIDHTSTLKKESYYPRNNSGRNSHVYDDFHGMGYRGTPAVPIHQGSNISQTRGELMFKAGVRMDEYVEFELDSFVPQNDKGPNRYWGSAFGVLSKKKNINVVYSGCPAEFFEAIKEGEADYIIKGKVVDVYMRLSARNVGQAAFAQELHVAVSDVSASTELDGVPYKMIPKGRGAGQGDMVEFVKVEVAAPPLALPPPQEEPKEKTVTVQCEDNTFLELSEKRWMDLSKDGCCVCTGDLSPETTIIDNKGNSWCINCASTNENDVGLVGKIIQFVTNNDKKVKH